MKSKKKQLSEFCQFLKDLKVDCAVCTESKEISACHVRAGLQEIYKDFASYDTMIIVREGTSTSLETDIEVTYKTKHPYGLAVRGF